MKTTPAERSTYVLWALVGVFDQHRLDRRFQRGLMSRDDAPEDDVADALIFVAEFVANGPDCVPWRRRMFVEPILRNTVHRLGYHQDRIGRGPNVGRTGLERIECRAVTDRMQEFDFLEDVV